MFLQEKFSLANKVAVVTGGNSGIGQQAAVDLAKAGASVAIISRRGAERTTAMIREQQGICLDVRGDVSDETSITGAIREIQEKFGRIDILLNCAGICEHKSALETSAADFRKITEINLTGAFLASREAAKVMVKQGIHGSIIHIASMSGHIVNVPQEQVSYNASKAGVIHMVKTLAIEWAKYGIRVNSISPGYIKTPMGNVPKEMEEAWMPMIPLHRWGSTEELTGMIIYLAGDASSLTTGADFIIDGAYSCL